MYPLSVSVVVSRIRSREGAKKLGKSQNGVNYAIVKLRVCCWAKNTRTPVIRDQIRLQIYKHRRQLQLQLFLRLSTRSRTLRIQLVETFFLNATGFMHPIENRRNCSSSKVRWFYERCFYLSISDFSGFAMLFLLVFGALSMVKAALRTL